LLTVIEVERRRLIVERPALPPSRVPRRQREDALVTVETRRILCEEAVEEFFQIDNGGLGADIEDLTLDHDLPGPVLTRVESRRHPGGARAQQRSTAENLGAHVVRLQRTTEDPLE
jgi:hypothetical protein